MDELQQYLFARGYIRLQPGSYHTWISGKWHAMFVRRGLVNKNFYKQYVPNTQSLSEFIKWLVLYDKAQHDRDYPQSYKQLTEAESIEIRREVY
jgi:hypothetical protein